MLLTKLKNALMLIAIGIPSIGPTAPAVKTPPQPPSLKEAMDKLEEAIEGESPDIKIGYRWWLKKWAHLIKAYHSFDARFRPKLDPGDIVRVDFGWNVGHELSGLHWAVVLGEKDDKKSPILVVVPLSSEKLVDGRPRETRSFERNLGYVIPQTEEELKRAGRTEPIRSIAVLNQLRAVSKQRVDYGTRHKLSKNQLNQLNWYIFSMLFGDIAAFGEAMAEVAASIEKAQEHSSESTSAVDKITRTR